MTTSLVEYDGFYGAMQARRIAMGQASGTNEILTEINTLQGLVDAAAAAGNLEVIVSGTTPMTSSTQFFDAFNDPFNFDTSADKLARAKMVAVINYFSRLGYAIKRERAGTASTFNWKIEW